MNLIQKENIKLFKYFMCLKVSKRLANNYFYRVNKEFELHYFFHFYFLVMLQFGKRARFFCKAILPGSVPKKDGYQYPGKRISNDSWSNEL